jgi:GT2 family glycosyltransferase
MKVSASLVLFHNEPAQYKSAIMSFLDGCDGVLYIVDNSSSPLKDPVFAHTRVKYLYFGSNLGFGKAHNRALTLVGNTSDVHLLLNPDVYFDCNVLPTMMEYLNSDKDIGVLMPKINYPDGTLQHLCKLLPTPVDLIFRRFIPLSAFKNRINQRYELHSLPQDRPSCVPTLSGCFLLVRTSILQQLGGFDERYFMYMEDVDLVRRIGDIAQTVYLPSVVVTHTYAKGSYRKKKLLVYHLESAIRYFFKWGWFFDKVRKKRNSEIINAICSATR